MSSLPDVFNLLFLDDWTDAFSSVIDSFFDLLLIFYDWLEFLEVLGAFCVFMVRFRGISY